MLPKNKYVATMSTTSEAGRSVAHLPHVMDDDLGEATSQDTERSQDGAKRVDPHEVDLLLQGGTQEVRRRHGRNAEAAMLRAYHRDGG